MASVFDVAAFILSKMSNLSTMKLQKLVFYSQAYCLVKYSQPFFSQRIEAWVNGPVVPDLYEAHKGQSVVSLLDMHFVDQPQELTPDQKKMVMHVLDVLGGLSGAQLSTLTHREKPWLEARGDLLPSERSQAPIGDQSIKAYYSSAECTNPLFAA